MSENAHPRNAEVVRRLASIEGHVRGLRQMAEDGRPCPEILLQVGAVEAALRKVAQVVLEDHLDHCVAEAPPDEIGDRLRELREALAHYVR